MIKNISTPGTFPWMMKRLRAGYPMRHSTWPPESYLMPDVEHTFDFVPHELHKKYQLDNGKFLMPTDGWEDYVKPKKVKSK